MLSPWVLYKLHVSVARAGDGSWPPARVGHGSNDIHKTTACTTPCTSHLETHRRDVSHAQRSHNTLCMLLRTLPNTLLLLAIYYTMSCI